MHPAFLYVPGDRLTLAELSAARLDGDVVELGDSFIPADLVESADARAASIARLVRAGTAAAGPTAAWIHGAGCAPPAVHHVQRATELRVRPHPSVRVVFHDSPLGDHDLVRLGGIAVASSDRTLLDLALGLHRDPRLRAPLEGLALAMPSDIDGALERLAALRRVPGSVTARIVLERLRVRTS